MSSQIGRIIHHVSCAVSRSGNGTSFSDQFLIGGWGCVVPNVRRACAAVPPSLWGGFMIDRPHGEWQDYSGQWQISLDAWQKCREYAAGDRDMGSISPDAHGERIRLQEQVEAIADVTSFVSAVNRLPGPCILYLGFEPPEWGESPDDPDIVGQLVCMLAPYIAARVARTPSRGGMVIVWDGLTGRPANAWLLARTRQLGFEPWIEDYASIGSPFDEMRAPQACTCYGRPVNYHYHGGLEGMLDRNSKTVLLFQPEEGTEATPALDSSGLRYGVTTDEAAEVVRHGGSLVMNCLDEALLAEIVGKIGLTA